MLCQADPETGKCTHASSDITHHRCPNWQKDMETQLDGVIRRALVHRGGSEQEAKRFQMDTCITLRVADMSDRISPDDPELNQRREMQGMITKEANRRLEKAEKLIEEGARKVRDDSEEGRMRAANEESWVQV